jgi:CO dehydrogenase maturation factor
MVILDMEAGIEHLGRGTAQHVDSLLVVTDADRKSLMIAASICRLTTGSEIRKIGLVGNRITGTQQEMILRTFAEKNGLDILAIIPYDLKVAESGITGVAIDEKTSVAVTAIQHLADEMQKE